MGRDRLRRDVIVPPTVVGLVEELSVSRQRERVLQHEVAELQDKLVAERRSFIETTQVLLDLVNRRTEVDGQPVVNLTGHRGPQIDLRTTPGEGAGFSSGPGPEPASPSTR
ncbi:MAG: hypothetical protein GY929_15195 [Actinomycetia bacterium]|nr:hypothetical protein [Actinomycetes bacterium]